MSALAQVLPMVWATVAQVTERKGPQRIVAGGVATLAVAAASLRSLVVVGPSPAKQEGFVFEDRKAPVAMAGQLAFYRKYTEGLLRRYVKMSMEAGRTPSLLGQEMFRGKVTSYKVQSFEDVVIFVHDVGRCVAKLDSGQQHMIRRIALQEYTQGETAAMTGLSLRTIHRRYNEAIDRLTAIFLSAKLMEPLSACQGGEAPVEHVSDSIDEGY